MTKRRTDVKCFVIAATSLTMKMPLTVKANNTSSWCFVVDTHPNVGSALHSASAHFALHHMLERQMIALLVTGAVPGLLVSF